MAIPKVGDKIYVSSSFYIDRGEDDICGGWGTISKVSTQMSGGKPTLFVMIEEVPDWWRNWEILQKEQEALKEHYGEQRAHPCPDFG